MADIHSILERYWGYKNFRPQQEGIIKSVLAGNDTLALLPTGGGKSLCYQVPALAQEGICLVVSPLIALMKDQVENLKKRGIGALVIYSGMNKKDIIRKLENARQEYFKFLYVSPERLETSLFKEYLPALNINLIAVDEAHCISQWGYDFRPSYLKIAALREELPDVPILAVTASATEAVQKDICEKLKQLRPPQSPKGEVSSAQPLLKQYAKNIPTSQSGPLEPQPNPPLGGRGAAFIIFRQAFERKNLSYSVFQEDVKLTKLVDIFKKVAGTGIVYCKSRKRTSEVAALLKMHGISADFYHAGLQQEERSKRQQAWIESKTRVIICTNAFGMGIDKADVRIVVHIDSPDCLENYYQEAGRCGRDGKKAYAVLLYDKKDVEELEALHLTRYPPLPTIKQVYEALVNFLQIAVNTGQDGVYTFRIDDFVRNFKLNVHQALYSLQALETDGWISYNEKTFTPSTIVFTTSKEQLYEFYKTYPQYETILVTLLRTYEGIFDFPAFISEILVARLVKEEEKMVQEILHKISAYGIIRYKPQNDDPQIIFRKNRVAVDDLQINLSSYNKRKEVFLQRVRTMINYLQTSLCRSCFINHYFGDEDPKQCGVCDNCLQKQKTALSSVEFNSIATTILHHVAKGNCNASQLASDLKITRRENIWEVLRFLQAENKIQTSPEGNISIIK